MKVLETERLILRTFDENDADFIIELLNSPGFLSFIGDRKVRSLEDAKDYIKNKIIAAYHTNGFGMWLLELKESGIPIGTCGLVNRDEIEEVDIGFAVLPQFMGKGYTYESAKEVLVYAQNKLEIEVIAAIVNGNNIASKALLKKLGYTYIKDIRMENGDNVEMMLPATQLG